MIHKILGKQGLPKAIAKKATSYKYDGLVMSSYELQAAASRSWKLEERSTELSYSYTSDIAPHSDDPSVHRRPQPDFVFRHPFVAELQDAAVVGPRAAVLTRDNKVIADSLKRPARHHEIHAHTAGTVLSRSYLRHRLSRLIGTDERTVEVAAVLHRKSSVQNFYHWLIERLLTLRGVSHYQEQTGTSVSLIVTRDAPGFVYDFIDHLGFSDNEIIRWDGGPIRADKIVVPSWPELTASGLEWLRERMVASVPAQQNSVEYVYVSRQRTAQRKVTNFDEIEPILWSYDVEPIFLGDISLEEEINLLRSADGIVGPHGAGLTGMIWPDHTKVLELFNGVVIPPFYLMADLLGHQYESILGEPAEMERSRRHRNTYIAPEEFEERLAGFVNAD